MNNKNNDESYMPRPNAKRLLKDVKSIMKEPLTSENIYYKHDEKNMLKGYALIIGPKETPYENGYYFFDLHFPSDYPYSPPKLIYKTNTEYIRFHPNFYKNGKVCISLLNTWPGDPWTSCQTIRSILITLSMLFDDRPLLHEPCITERHYDFNSYNEIIQYKNLEFSYFKIGYELSKKSAIITTANYFDDVIVSHFQDNIEYMIDKVKQLKEKFPESKRLSTTIYGMTNVEINYIKLITLFSVFKK